MTELLERLKAAIGDRYAIEREVGAGGMATVYLAQDLKHNRNVAVKVLRPELAAALGGDRFVREIEIAAQIEHPHVLTLIDSGDADGILYYVMPFVKGESLRARMAREGQLPVSDTIRMLRDVADGLAEAHRQGLVHRDIKPDNVMISGRHAVVTDFGVAKAVTSATGAQALTTAGVSLGTPAYMSPEQAGAEPVDHRTDIYALGVMGYELLTGKPPFTAGTTQEVLIAHMTVDPEPVTAGRPDTPPALERLIMRCLAKKPGDRWASTDEVLQQLELMSTPSGGVESVRVQSVTAPRGPRRFLTRRALVTVPILLAIGAFAVVQQRRADATRALMADIQAAVDSGDLDSAYALLTASGRDLGDRALSPVALATGGRVTIAAPARSTVEIARGTRTLDGFTDPVPLGEAPIEPLTLLAGEYRLTLSAEGHGPGEFMVRVATGDTIAVTLELVPAAWSASDMVIVPAGAVPGPLASLYAGTEVPAFLVDRHEVTNRRFMEFVADGGYRNPDYWPDRMETRDGLVPRERALAALVDRTGLAGPRGWSGGRFPDGREDYPVAGISWYEAAAFARWAGGALPTAEQWWRAALGDGGSRFPWGDDFLSIDDRSNFGGSGTTPVGRFPYGASPFGAADMAGNVREWLATSQPDGRFAVIGGSWQTPTYMFDSPNVESFAPWYQSAEVGFRLVKPKPAP
ncbi:MAG TPA: bifunctional serine/threonine-protein kinase/formylglycine-generating enzyme family protein [Gemmatimonadales bacterium]|jgi:tRNA A-37 threonylcarbamoyl transferase component Bud32